MVGAARFELTTPCAQGRCATRLRYAPMSRGNNRPLGPANRPYTVLAAGRKLVGVAEERMPNESAGTKPEAAGLARGDFQHGRHRLARLDGVERVGHGLLRDLGDGAVGAQE